LLDLFENQGLCSGHLLRERVGRLPERQAWTPELCAALHGELKILLGGYARTRQPHDEEDKLNMNPAFPSPPSLSSHSCFAGDSRESAGMGLADDAERFGLRYPRPSPLIPGGKVK